MANVFGFKQWKLDTASASAITTDKVRIKSLEFVPNAASDACTIVDRESEGIWNIVAAGGGGANQANIDFGAGQDFRGFTLTALGSSCALYVYLA